MRCRKQIAYGIAIEIEADSRTNGMTRGKGGGRKVWLYDPE